MLCLNPVRTSFARIVLIRTWLSDVASSVEVRPMATFENLLTSPYLNVPFVTVDRFFYGMMVCSNMRERCIGSTPQINPTRKHLRTCTKDEEGVVVPRETIMATTTFEEIVIWAGTICTTCTFAHILRIDMMGTSHTAS